MKAQTVIALVMTSFVLAACTGHAKKDMMDSEMKSHKMEEKMTDKMVDGAMKSEMKDKMMKDTMKAK